MVSEFAVTNLGTEVRLEVADLLRLAKTTDSLVGLLGLITVNGRLASLSVLFIVARNLTTELLVVELFEIAR